MKARTQKENRALLASDPILGTGAATAPTAPSPRASTELPSFARMDAANRLTQKLVERGIPPIVAAGMVGNAGGESGFDTGAIGDNGTSFGLIQARGPRAEALKRLAAQQGKSWKDEDVQVDHIVAELNGPERAAYDKAKQAKNAREAAYILAQHYERPAAWALKQSAPKRMAIAERAYATHAGQPGAVQVASADPGFVPPVAPPLPPQRPSEMGGLGGLGGMTGAPETAAPLTGPTQPAWQTAQATPKQFDAQLAQARGQEVAGYRGVPKLQIPMPVPQTDAIPTLPQRIPRNAVTSEASSSLKAAGYETPGNPQDAYQKAVGIARRIQLYEARGMKVDGLKPIMEHYLRLALPTEVQRNVAAAFPGDPVAQMEALRRGLTDNTPTSIREAEYVTRRPDMRETVKQMKQAGAQNVTTKVEGAGSELMMRKGIEAFDAAQEAARAATIRTTTLGQMAQAMQGFTPGALAEHKLSAKRVLKDLGIIGDEGVSDAEAFQKAARKLQVTAQPKGQGSVSNEERRLLAEAVPGMANSPEGLAKAIAMATRLDDYDRKVAEIHRQSARANGGNPNYLDVSERIAALGPPLTPAEMSALEALKEGKPAQPGDRSEAPSPKGAVVESCRKFPRANFTSQPAARTSIGW